MAKNVKVLTKAVLVKLNQDAYARKARRYIRLIVAQKLPDDKFFPVADHALIDDGLYVRVRLVMNEAGDTDMLDIPIAAFNRLPTKTIP